jgi:hypothetical protein
MTGAKVTSEEARKKGLNYGTRRYFARDNQRTNNSTRLILRKKREKIIKVCD